MVKDGQIIGTGVTAKGGRPHAETQALDAAGAAAKGAALYVSLEPCCHQGQTPPCTDAIIASGVRRVVIGCSDANPLISGNGITKLADAGIEVTCDVLRNEAYAVNQGFFSVLARKRPFVSLKIATSQDGKIATASGASQWITGESARKRGHLLRAQSDAILCGMGTVAADDPQLTCRLGGLENHQPVRVITDRKGVLRSDSALAKSAKETPVWVMSGAEHPNKAALEKLGVVFFAIERDDDTGFLPAVLSVLAQQGITRLLVEAGQKLSSAFMRSGLVDQIYWFRAPLVIGNDGLAAFDVGFDPDLASLPRWHHTEHITLDTDSLDIYTCLPESSVI